MANDILGITVVWLLDGFLFVEGQKNPCIVSKFYLLMNLSDYHAQKYPKFCRFLCFCQRMMSVSYDFNRALDDAKVSLCTVSQLG